MCFGKCLKTFSKKKGSSLFHAYIFANVKVLLSVFMSTIINRKPFACEIVLRIWKEKLLLSPE